MMSMITHFADESVQLDSGNAVDYSMCWSCKMTRVVQESNKAYSIKYKHVQYQERDRMSTWVDNR